MISMMPLVSDAGFVGDINGCRRAGERSLAALSACGVVNFAPDLTC